SVVVAGALLMVEGGGLLSLRWVPSTIALVHLGTLGFLGCTMLGALYQMVPVVAGAVVPAPRAAHGVVLALLGGTAALVLGLTIGLAGALKAATLLLGLALLAFLVPAGWALARAPV